MRIIKYDENDKLKQVTFTLQLDGVDWNRFNVQEFEPLDIIRSVKSKFNPGAIQEVVYEYFALPVALQDKMKDAKDMGRVSRLVSIRKLCYFFIRKYTDMSLADIGRLYGQDHATVLHHVRGVGNALEMKEKEITSHVDDINRIIINQLT